MVDKVKITFPDGSVAECDRGVSFAQLLREKRVNPSGVLAAKVNGVAVDLNAPVEGDALLEPITFESDIGKEIYRHSTSHIMAQAVKRVFPQARVAIGPAIENGFYYDFDVEEPFSPEDLERIERSMRDIISEDQPFVREVIPRRKAMELFETMGESYKVELLKEMDEEEVSIYRNDDFIDLCRGPHVTSTGPIKAVKLISTAGAYWRGDERNRMLQRIYGTSFPDEEELNDHLRRLEEAKKRDHRLLGKQLDIFSIHEQAGPGLVYWHPKGAILRRVIERFWEDEHLRRGYHLVNIPHIALDKLFRTSGHYDFYRENMFVLNIDENEYVLKPMNCPGHIMIYKDKLRSYRDLPIRYAELGTVYRYERSGVLHGMLRVRGFTQDDAHIFCTPEQVNGEILGVLDLASYMLKVFGYKEFEVDLSVRDPSAFRKYAGSDQEWEMAENALIQALKARDMEYERREGEAVFYGPKIDIKMVDALGRGWQGPTIQFDFNVPKKFDVTYVGPDGAAHHVIMVHRTVLGSMERFVGGLIEHYGGNFPLWLAPVQVKMLTITDRHVGYSKEVAAKLREHGIRVEEDYRNEKVGYKVREALMDKVPYMLIVGDREVAGRTVSVRKRGDDLGSMPPSEFMQKLEGEVSARII